MSDRELNRIQLIDPVSEDALIVFGDTGAGQGQFKQAGGLARTWRGDILVADSENARLQSLSQCTPSCSEEFNCGSNGCGGLCGVCFGDAQCIDGRCVDAFDGGAGCTGGTTPGCDGCECETCVCDLDPFCCETAFDNNCVGACVLECGGGCPDPGIAPELEPTMVYQATIGESDGNTFIQPTELFIDGSNRVWVIDSVSTKIKAFQLTP